MHGQPAKALQESLIQFHVRWRSCSHCSSGVEWAETVTFYLCDSAALQYLFYAMAVAGVAAAVSLPSQKPQRGASTPEWCSTRASWTPHGLAQQLLVLIKK